MFISEIVVHPFTVEMFAILLLVVILLLVTAFISASEMAFFSLSPHDMNDVRRKATQPDSTILELKEHPERLLATILIANSTINVAVVILTTFLIGRLFDFHAAVWLGFLIQTVIITFLLLLIGEITPKIYAAQNPLRFSRKAASVLRLLDALLRPFASVLIRSGGLVDKRLAKKGMQNISMDELSQALELTSKGDDSDKDILEGIIKFGNKNVSDVMTARVDIAAIDIVSSFSEVKQQVIEMGYSRIPVYQGSMDNVKGVLYNKDLLPYLDKGDLFKWRALIRNAYFVPETKKIDDLLKDFQSNKNHLAVVVDEFGGTSGIVTLEDILEEVVGEIDDEYDETEKLFTVVDAHTIDFEAKILLSDFFRAARIDEAEFDDVISGVDSLAGLILELKGDIPELHEQIVFGRYMFDILEVDERRIIRVRLSMSDEIEPA
jgi:gliding motility-associated protein GldE